MTTTAARCACLALATLATGCAHAPRPAVLRAAGALDCEVAAGALQAPWPDPRGDRLRRAVTAPASWLLVGMAYTTDFTVTAAGGVAAGAVVCMPVLLLEASLGGDGRGSGECVAMVAGSAIETGGLFDLGPHAARATRRWRCLDRTGEALEVLAAAGCFRGRGGPGDEAAARRLLAGYALDRARLDCTPHRERRAIEWALEGPGSDAAPEAAPGGPDPRDTRTPEAGAPEVQDGEAL